MSWRRKLRKSHELSELHKEITVVILEAVNMSHLDVQAEDYAKPLRGEPFNFDSIDFLEIVVAVEEKFGVELESSKQAPIHFKTIETIADFVNTNSQKA